MEKISSTDRGKNEELSHRVKKDMNILHKLKRSNAKWVGDILRRNCILRHATEGKIKGTGNEKEDVSIYWMTLRKLEIIGS
jgi:hypothetical protein